MSSGQETQLLSVLERIACSLECIAKIHGDTTKPPENEPKSDTKVKKV